MPRKYLFSHARGPGPLRAVGPPGRNVNRLWTHDASSEGYRTMFFSNKPKQATGVVQEGMTLEQVRVAILQFLAAGELLDLPRQ